VGFGELWLSSHFLNSFFLRGLRLHLVRDRGSTGCRLLPWCGPGVLVGINVGELEFNRFLATILILTGVPLLLR
jgi:hypothetical protein